MKIQKSLLIKLIKEALSNVEREMISGATDAKSLKRAYRKLALKYHPDRSDDEEAFKEIDNLHIARKGDLGIKLDPNEQYYYDQIVKKRGSRSSQQQSQRRPQSDANDIKNNLKRSRSYSEFKSLYAKLVNEIRPQVANVLIDNLESLYKSMINREISLDEYWQQHTTVLTSAGEDDRSPTSPRYIFYFLMQKELRSQPKPKSRSKQARFFEDEDDIINSAKIEMENAANAEKPLLAFMTGYKKLIKASGRPNNEQSILLSNLGELIKRIRTKEISVSALPFHIEYITSGGMQDGEYGNPRNCFEKVIKSMQRNKTLFRNY